VRVAITSKGKVSARISAMIILSKIFEKFWGRMVTPCTDEIFEVTKKIYKANSDPALKEASLQML
jgi:hypothetical protein